MTETNLAVLAGTLAELADYKLIEPEGTFLAWVDARPQSEDELRQRWTGRAHVVPSYGTDFGPEYGGFLRVNLATPTDMFRDAMERVRACHP